MKTIVRLFSVLAAFGGCSVAFAASSGVSHSDKNFFEKAAKAGTEEVAVSQAALPHLTNAEVKAFAQMMISDHSGANEELKALAARKAVTLPAKQPDTDKWDKAKAKNYDEEYIKKMVNDHKDAVDLFTKTARQADDADVRTFASKTLPTLQHHFDQAKSLKEKVK